MSDTPHTAAREVAKHIPLELINEILVKLPVSAILKFRRVCKSWRGITQEREFIDRHLQNNKRDSSSLNIIYLSNDPRNHKLSLLSYFFKDRYKSNMRPERGSMMSNSCDGLISVFQENDGTATYVVNSSTKEILKLPVSPNGVTTVVSVALVRGSATGEYKVVRFLW